MHWEGQTTMQRPQATHLVLPPGSFSKYWTPLHAGAGGVFSSGYWTVIGLEKNIFSVSFKPFSNGMIIFSYPLTPPRPRGGRARGNLKYWVTLLTLRPGQ